MSQPGTQEQQGEERLTSAPADFRGAPPAASEGGGVCPACSILFSPYFGVTGKRPYLPHSPCLRLGDTRRLRLAHGPTQCALNVGMVWGWGPCKRLMVPLDLQRPGQLLLLPGGLPDERAGSGREVHHLHHPPAQRQALRDVRPGTSLLWSARGNLNSGSQLPLSPWGCLHC